MGKQSAASRAVGTLRVLPFDTIIGGDCIAAMNSLPEASVQMLRAGECLPGGVGVGHTLHTIKGGINYHFNWGAPGPVVASY